MPFWVVGVHSIIPEARAWFAKLFEAWPYWSFFASRIDQTVPLVLSLLLSGEAVAGEPGMAGWSFDIDENGYPLDPRKSL